MFSWQRFVTESYCHVRLLAFSSLNFVLLTFSSLNFVLLAFSSLNFVLLTFSSLNFVRFYEASYIGNELHSETRLFFFQAYAWCMRTDTVKFEYLVSK